MEFKNHRLEESKILLGTDLEGDESLLQLHPQLTTAKIPGAIPPLREQLGLVFCQSSMEC